MLWEKNLIYQATRPNNYCPDCKTTLADADVIYEELPAQLVYIKFKLSGKNEFITVATTRPELICSCQAILVHPEDERYKNLIGQKVILPIYEREVPILSNRVVDRNFGSGIVMICSYGDTTDVRLFRELGLKEIMAIGLDGKMNEKAGKYAGLEVKEARKKIIEDLEAEGLVEKKEAISHRTPICERCKTPIEIISLDEFYLKQIPFLQQIKRLAKKIIFHPEQHRQILYNWIDSITIDWPISRRRFYGTEVPIWYCKKCGKPNLPEPGKYYQPWRENPPFKECKYCKGKEFIGETRTFDTWFDSSISPLFISKFLRDEKFFKKTFPNSIRPQAKDIVRTWLYYTLLRCYQLTGKQAWKHAWIMGYGIDEKGEKMSKSKGNVIDPLPILEKYGADSFRFWSASEVSLGYDFRCSEQRVASASKFLTKIWNIARFISCFPQPKKVKLTKTDKWILSELNELIKQSLKGYEDFNFFIPATKVREFAWNLFASHYIEMVKARAYGKGFNKKEQESAWFTLHECLKNILLLLAPIIPFVTDYIWRKLYSKESIHIQKFPRPKAKFESKMRKKTEKLIEFNSKVWSEKKKLGLPLNASIKIKVPKELKEFERDLKAMHNLE
jgi:valyl-tRNA synthetase